MLLGYCKGTYQFPDGYVEQDESIKNGLKREIQEETGIDINPYDEDPFYVIKYYSKDWPKEGINRYTEFNYFLVKTDLKVDYSKTNLDEFEKEHNYEIRYVNLDELEKVLNESLEENPKNKKVYSEMIDVIKIYYENSSNEK